MRLTPWIVCLLVPTLVGARAFAEGAPGNALPSIMLENCTIEYDRSSTLGAYVSIYAGSRIQDCYVRRGDRVKAGQVLMRLFDRDVQNELKRLAAIAASDLAIRSAEARLEYCTARLKRSAILRERHVLSEEDWNLHYYEKKDAELDLEQAKLDHQTAILARDRQEADVRSKEIVSPYDGMVVEILKTVGETAVPNERVIQIVSVDLLRVTGYLDARDVWRVQVGQHVRITPNLGGSALPIEREAFAGMVVFIDPRIDPTTQTCKIMAEVLNRDSMLRSGLQCRMEILLNGSAGPTLPTNPERADYLSPLLRSLPNKDHIEPGATRVPAAGAIPPQQVRSSGSVATISSSER